MYQNSRSPEHCRNFTYSSAKKRPASIHIEIDEMFYSILVVFLNSATFLAEGKTVPEKNVATELSKKCVLHRGYLLFLVLIWQINTIVS